MMTRSLGALGAGVLALGMCSLHPAALFAQSAEVTQTSPRDDASGASGASGSTDASGEDFSFMHLLARHGRHDLEHEQWNAYGQFTWISSWKLPFNAPYTNLNGSNRSLLPGSEHSYTATATAFVGFAPWRGAEAYVVPEVISSRPLSELAGLGASIQNFELQKQGQISPSVYLSRAYLTQTIDFGGSPVVRASGPMQLGTTVKSRRLVLAVGNLSVLDFFDRNSVVGDPRRQFFNIAFLTHGAFDFVADARGYTWGALFELHFDDWAVRAGRFIPPKQPNQLALDFRFYEYYGDQIEIEHVHRIEGRPGVVRLLGYRNREVMGAFSAANAALDENPNQNAAACQGYNYGSTNATAPDLCWVRRPQAKVGMGISLEQQLSDDFGVFARGMISDGRTEVYSYTSSDRSASLGLVAHGAPWHRPGDTLAVACAASWISAEHARYLGRGGVDGFIGDGAIDASFERVLELFYSARVLPSLWLSADFQHIDNPAYNAARGPVSVLAGRVHSEF